MSDYNGAFPDIGLLRIRRMLYGPIRLLWSCSIEEEAIESIVLKMKLFLEAVFENVKRAALNLCFGGAFLIIRKVLAIAGSQKLLLNAGILKF